LEAFSVAFMPLVIKVGWCFDVTASQRWDVYWDTVWNFCGTTQHFIMYLISI